MPRLLPVLALCALLPGGASAQTLLPGDHSIDGNLCAGPDCTGSESFGGFDDLKLKSTGLGILFDDVGGTSTHDWRIRTNDTNEDSFWIEDVTDGTAPFKILGFAPNNSLFVASDGDIGLGTSIPQAPLHVETTSGAGIRLNRSNTNVGPQAWQSVIDSNGSWGLFDATNSRGPLGIRAGTPSNSLFLAATVGIFNGGFQDYDFDVRAQGSGSLIFGDAGTGRVGLGTSSPASPLHVTRGDGSAEVLVEETSSTPAARGLFTMRNNGGSFFTLDNTAAGTTWFFTHENSAPNRFIIADGVADGPEFTLTAGGDVTIPGNFISGATTLNVPDYVFGPDYALRPLSEVQAFIDTNRHLPEVPSAAQIAATGLDMTDMQMTLLKKVEELTLYTLEQEARLARMDRLETENAALAARLAAQDARLARLETALAR